MALFKFNKKKGVLDLTKRDRINQERVSEIKQEIRESKPQSSGSAFSFLGSLAGSGSSVSGDETGYVNVSETDERRKKLAKRLMDMTEKLEEISNQIYHLQQRIEVIERKTGVGSKTGF